MNRPLEKTLTGVVLAGGRSQRMQTDSLLGDKFLLSLDQQPILSHVISRLAPQTARIILNAGGAPQRFSQFALPVIEDCFGIQAGPLSGILTAMRYAAADQFVVTAAADTPFFPTDLVAQLTKQQMATQADVVFAASFGQVHPTFGLWRTCLADDLQNWLESGEHASVKRYAQRRISAAFDFAAQILPSGVEFDPFFNINTPDDLDKARYFLKELAR